MPETGTELGIATIAAALAGTAHAQAITSPSANNIMTRRIIAITSHRRGSAAAKG